MVCAALAVNPYLVLDADMASELVLSNLLAREGGILTTQWYYSTELRVLNTQLIYSLFFRIWNNWRFVRVGGTIALLVILLLCCRYFCCQVGLKRCFPAIGGVMLVPFLWMGHYVLSYGSYYVPHLCITFVALGLGFHCAKAPKGWRHTVLMAVSLLLAFVSGLGGLRQLFIFYVPAAIAAFALTAYERLSLHETQHALPPVVTILFAADLAAAFAGYWVNTGYLSRSHLFSSFNSIAFTYPSVSRLDGYLNNWLQNLGYQAGAVFSIALVYNLCFGVIFLSAFFCLRTLWRHMAQYPPAQRFLLFFCVLLFLLSTGLVLFGENLDYYFPFASPRYNCLVAIPFIPLVAAVLYRYRAVLPLRGLCIAMSAVMVFLSVQYLQPYFTTPPGNTAAERLTAFLLDNDYYNGYALSFWNGNLFTELSNGQIDVRVLSVPTLEASALNTTYKWLQRVDHDTTTPDGKVFVLFSEKEDDGYPDSAVYLGAENILYTDYPYILYGFDSYAALVEQLNTPLPQAPAA